MAMKCPSCGHGRMLFESHHGMEHNVCEQCGTVIECVSLVMDVYEKGTREVPLSYFNKPTSYKNEFLLNPRMKPYAESKEVMIELMDKLNLPSSARELALHFLMYSKSLNKRCSVGACVYLAMKRHDIPITIKYIANYLQVSHFSIGKVMKKLENRIGPSAQGTAFNLIRLPNLIFSQAKFGGSDGGKKRLDLLLSKTEQLLLLLQHCLNSSSCHPHLFILAAGYVVWRNLIIYGWKGANDESSSDDIHLLSLGKATLKSFLSEVNIQLSHIGSLDEKVNLIYRTLKKCACHIPWLSDKVPSKVMVCIHLDDILKYKSQIVNLTSEDVVKEENIKTESLSEESFKSRNHTEENDIFTDCKGYSTDVNDTASSSENVDASSTPMCSFSINLDAKLGFSPVLIKTERNEEVGRKGLLFRKVKYTRVTNLSKGLGIHKKLKKEFDSNGEASHGINKKNCDECQNVVGKESYTEMLDFL